MVFLVRAALTLMVSGNGIINLAVQRWTLFADVYPTSQQGASPVGLTGGSLAASADALAGNDRITGTGNTSLGQGVGSLLDNGRFYMSLGNDYFAGTGAAGTSSGSCGFDGISLTNGSILNTGVSVGLLGLLPLDDDTVVGNGGAGGNGANGVNATSTVAAANGETGGSGGDGVNVSCSSTILTGDGGDSITGTGGAGGMGGTGGAGSPEFPTGANGGDGGDGGDGIYVSKSSSIDTGSGADRIIGIGGSGGSGGTAGAAGTSGSAGNAGNNGKTGAGIHNKGTINMGSGNDTINALQGGFAGCGTYQMGSGNDRVYGFGTGTFNGGSGFDRLYLPGLATDYVVTLDPVPGNYSIQRISDSLVMTANSFESLSFNA